MAIRRVQQHTDDDEVIVDNCRVAGLALDRMPERFNNRAQAWSNVRPHVALNLPDAGSLAELIRDEAPRIDDLAEEYEYFAAEIEDLMADYAPDTVWEAGVKFYNEGRSPAALFPVAVMAIQRQTEGNSTVFLRANDVEGNVVVPPY